jgi:FkbM family methyltransferase
MLTRFDPLVSSLARGIDYLSPRLSPPLAFETSVTVGPQLRLMMPAGLPSARRLLAGDYEPEVSALMRSLLRSGMTFVDAGANVGYYTLLAADLVGETGHVYAFEPDQDSYAYLVMNVSSNRITQATVHRKALAETPGTRAFTPSAWEGGYVSTRPTSSQSVRVETESLDHFFRGEGWPPVHLIKLDVEGAEASVLAGMGEVIERNPLQLVMEFNLATIRRAGGTPDQLCRTLRGLGFQNALIVEQGRQVSLNDGLPSSGLVYNLLLTK